MYLANLKLWNFRKYGSTGEISPDRPNLDLDFKKGLNVLIGENDSGKTAIIDAIKLVLKTHSYEFIKVTEEDFFNKCDRFRIELVFKDFLDNEAANFTEWLSWEGEGANATTYLKLTYDVSRNDGRILPADIRAGADDEGYLLTAQAREFLKVTYLKPLRDAKAELVPKRNSRLSQIFQEHEAFKGKHDNHHLLTLFNDFNKKIEKYFEGKEIDDSDLPDSLGRDLKEEIDSYLQSFYIKNKQTDISVNEGDLKSILEKLELLIKDEINIGLGSLNRLFIASELLHLKKKNWDGIRLGLIEELEAHLHPQAQMKVVESLQKHNSVQLILSTHSPNLASKVRLENLIFCCGNNAFPLGKEQTKLDPDDYAFLERFLDVTKSNLFFAKGVILVEGWAEEILLPALAKHMKNQGLVEKDLTEAGVSIVNVGSTALLNYAKIFQRRAEPLINVPVSIVTDVDVRTYQLTKAVSEDGRPIEVFEKLNADDVKSQSHQKLISLFKKYIDQNTLSFISTIWTLEYSLLHSKALGGIFKAIVKGVHSGSDWDTDFEKELAKKLIKKSLDKVEISYKLAWLLEQDLQKENPEIKFEFGDTISYLTDAIMYACDN